MGIEQMAVDAVFASDIARDAVYVKGAQAPIVIRVIPTTPDLRREIGGADVQGRQRLIDVRVSDVPNPVAGDLITPHVEDGLGGWVPGAETLLIAKRPERSDRCALIWTIDLVKA